MGPHQATTTASAPFKDRISYNICQSAVDTVTSKISKNKPRPYYVTSAGDHEQQAKAKKQDPSETSADG